mmetsp:Transcript_27033/g.41459  ORF Transcript_27033/g.41459 Transcript_27033/m.41459 type:complete len:244 (-) Transcript_27033:37-768(-)
MKLFDTLVLLVSTIVCLSQAFVVVPTTAGIIKRQLQQQQQQQRQQLAPLFMGGFGASNKKTSSKNKKKNNKKKDTPTATSKIKPKAQWDRYNDDSMRDVPPVDVAVRVVVSDEEEPPRDWIPVGRVKSADNNSYTDIAVARQRALIADHVKRVAPGKVSPTDRIQWGYRNGNDDGDYWTVINAKELDAKETPPDIEKLIGFEGIPDPASGYYCKYDAGKLVNADEVNKERMEIDSDGSSGGEP